MKTKKDKERQRIALQIDDEVFECINILRDKHNVNISGVCRTAIIQLCKKLEAVQ
jgi:hypothetical protein